MAYESITVTPAERQAALAERFWGANVRRYENTGDTSGALAYLDSKVASAEADIYQLKAELSRAMAKANTARAMRDAVLLTRDLEALD